jgi:ketosteroid isomerase-like protein
VGRFSKAFVEADVSILNTLLSEDYIHTNSTGSVLNKQQWLEYNKTRRADLEAGRLEIESYENKDLRIRVYGESAIVTGTNVAKGKREGKPFVTELRFTHLWIKQSGQWKRAAFHDSAVTS